MDRDNLPVLSTSFVGREKELAEIVGLLRGPDCRLLTLFGPGGSGKTRLALEAASVLQHHFAGGAAFVALQPVSRPLFIAPAIAEAVGLAMTGARDPEEQLLDGLSDKQLLLVLDNFEALLEGAGLVANLLAAAPGVKVLVTSREVLNLQEEWVRSVPGLAFPEAEQSSAAGPTADYGAVRLFSERARQVRPDFSLEENLICVARICRLVEGLPLALELAATWLRTLSCEEVAGEIARNLDFLETPLRNMPARHRSMRAVFEQSWQLLPPKEQEVFARLSVFQGGCTRAAANAVAAAGLASLQGLVDRSLLRVTAAGRYETHELLRQYAAEALAADPAALDETQERHSSYFAAFLAQQEPRLKGPEQQGALRLIDAELDNLRLAWHRTVERRAAGQIEEAMGAYFLYCQMRSRLFEGLESFRAAARARVGGDDTLQIKLELLETWFEAAVASDPEPTVRFYRSAFEEVRPLGREEAMAMPLCFFAWTAGLLEDVSPLQQFYAANYAFHQEQGSKWGMAWAAYALGTMPSMMYGEERLELEDLAEGVPYLEESAALFRALGNRWAVTYALHAAGQTLLMQEAYERAREMFRESLQICREVGDPGGVAFALHCLGEAAAGLQEYEGSWRYLNDALQVSYQHRSEMVSAHLFEMAAAFAAAGQPLRAVELLAFLVKESNIEWIQSHVPARLSALAQSLPERAFATAQRYGEQIDQSTLVQTLAAEFGSRPEGEAAAAPAQPAGAAALLVEALTERELEVLQLVAEGLSNRQIAERLTVTVGTVKKHLNNISGKLQANSRTHAVARARALSLIP